MRAALAEHDGVVSLGGGAITTPGVREALAGHTVIYLEISAAEGVRRTRRQARSGRCWPAPIRPRGSATLMSQRVPLYREVATIRVNTNRRNPGAVVRLHRAPAGGRRVEPAAALTPSQVDLAASAHGPRSGPDHRGPAESRGVGPQSGSAQ